LSSCRWPTCWPQADRPRPLHHMSLLPNPRLAPCPASALPERRIGVVANGLPLWHGSQLALDATIVSPLTRRGEAHPRADIQPGCAVSAAAWRKRHNTYPELCRARRCRLVVLGLETGGRFGTEAAQFLRLLARHRAAAVPQQLRAAATTAWVAAVACPLQSPHCARSLPPCWSCSPPPTLATGRSQSCMSSSQGRAESIPSRLTVLESSRTGSA